MSNAAGELLAFQVKPNLDLQIFNDVEVTTKSDSAFYGFKTDTRDGGTQARPNRRREEHARATPSVICLL